MFEVIVPSPISLDGKWLLATFDNLNWLVIHVNHMWTTLNVSIRPLHIFDACIFYQKLLIRNSTLSDHQKGKKLQY